MKIVIFKFYGSDLTFACSAPTLCLEALSSDLSDSSLAATLTDFLRLISLASAIRHTSYSTFGSRSREAGCPDLRSAGLLKLN